jgi:hypothetical protein
MNSFLVYFPNENKPDFWALCPFMGKFGSHHIGLYALLWESLAGIKPQL